MNYIKTEYTAFAKECSIGQTYLRTAFYYAFSKSPIVTLSESTDHSFPASKILIVTLS